ncbi:alkaline phosphatase family protein [Pseudomonas luteola]|uniref:alkaline phosphatase D family protein n=1 Tax=Pseudomonas luteola TaxID=47886 RepID=UPI001EF4AD0F|nr:alkaline phosphatase D family protein [Pseudomonas luteola]MCG7375264.1 alkaline phosphatase family protein [Pseudomonas luteola]
MGITVGPIIGHTTHNSSKIWIRGEEGKNNDTGKYCYGAIDLYSISSQGPQHLNSYFFHLKDYYDFTGALSINGLMSDTKYELHCGTQYFNKNNTPQLNIPLSHPINTNGKYVSTTFRTARESNNNDKLRFAFGSCRYFYWDNLIHSDAEKGDKTFKSILSHHTDESPLDLVLMLGDQVYADPLNIFLQYENLPKLFELYQNSFSLPNIRKLMSQVSTYMILDDHEIKNNWSKDQMNKANQGLYTNAMSAYSSYQHLHNPDTPNGQYWYTFKRGSFPFFVMDTRTQRINEPKGISTKTMLGREQLNYFLEWLHQNKESPYLFAATSVPFFPDTKNEDDKWASFVEERSIILEFIRLEKIYNLIFLCGDVHNSSFARMSCYQDPSFKLISLVSSPFYWPYPHTSGSDFYNGRTLEFMQWADSNRRFRDRIEYRYEANGFISEESYILVEINLNNKNKSGSAKIFNRKGRQTPGALMF